jgi:hypothetical protein
MRCAPIPIVAALLAAVGANAATIHVDAHETCRPCVTTVTVTLTTHSPTETVQAFSGFGVTIGWNPTLVRVVGSNQTTTFGKSAQSPILPGLTGSFTPSCVSSGVNKGKACAVSTQAALTPTVLAGGQIVIGTLLLEEVPFPEGGYGSLLGLSIIAYDNNGVTSPAADPNLTLTPGFTNAMLGMAIPEPTTAALLGAGLIGLGGSRRRTP